MRSGRIYGIILAAGMSSRMGRPKQLLDWHGQPLVRHIAEQAQASDLDGLVVVVGAGAPAVRAALTDVEPRLQIVENGNFHTGQASSLRCGVAALAHDAAAGLILLVDQPLIHPALINRVLDCYRQDPEAEAVIPHYHEQPGHPVVLGAELFADIQTLQGDSGARVLFARRPQRVRRIVIDDPAVINDIDTPEAYARLTQGSGRETL
jgi:molybdenum cofactor cytidylyltransferase